MDERQIGDRYADIAFLEAGKALGHISAAMQGYRNLSVFVQGMSIRGPKVSGDEFLVTLRGETGDGEPVVAFHSGVELGEVIRGISARLNNGTLTWKPDGFARR